MKSALRERLAPPKLHDVTRHDLLALPTVEQHHLDRRKAYICDPSVGASPRNQLPLHQLGWNPPLKFTVDAEVGPNLAVVKKWQVAA